MNRRTLTCLIIGAGCYFAYAFYRQAGGLADRGEWNSAMLAALACALSLVIVGWNVAVLVGIWRGKGGTDK